MTDNSHRRRNPLTGRHVLVSPHRAKRPWLGQEDVPDNSHSLSHDPNCYLCPGNERVGGIANPDYANVFTFENDFPALLQEAADVAASSNELFNIMPVTGRSRVICFSPDHSATLPRLSHDAMCAVVDAWCEETASLGQEYPWVQVFENKGAMMGCSNPHPHGQVWATSYLPDEAALEDQHQRDYFAKHGQPMLLEVVEKEIQSGERVVSVNEHWVALVPFWASWPFETLLLPRFPVARMPDLSAIARSALASIVQDLTRRYDGLFSTSFPYSMGWHGAPFDGSNGEGWQLHAHFYPPLLRSAIIRKFMVGFEMLAEAQRDLTPEQAAERLRMVKI